MEDNENVELCQRYIVNKKLGVGTYGEVFSAFDKVDDRSVAVKRLRGAYQSMRQHTLRRAVREIRLLRCLGNIHGNIVKILNIFALNNESSTQLNKKTTTVTSMFGGSLLDEKDLYVVFDIMETDLHRIIHSKQTLTDEHARYFMYQLFCGLNFIHSAGICHRDLKPANLLVNSNCQLRIADFGMARYIDTQSPLHSHAQKPFHPELFKHSISNSPEGNNVVGPSSSSLLVTHHLTQYVMTRWYRAPELIQPWLLSTSLDPPSTSTEHHNKLLIEYDFAVDLWSSGCILAELYTRQPLFTGKNPAQQWALFEEKLGPNWRDMTVSTVPRPMLLPSAPAKANNLLWQLLSHDPSQRPSAQRCVRHLLFNAFRKPDKETPVALQIELPRDIESMDEQQLRMALQEELEYFENLQVKNKINPQSSSTIAATNSPYNNPVTTSSTSFISPSTSSVVTSVHQGVSMNTKEKLRQSVIRNLVSVHHQQQVSSVAGPSTGVESSITGAGGSSGTGFCGTIEVNKPITAAERRRERCKKREKRQQKGSGNQRRQRSMQSDATVDPVGCDGDDRALSEDDRQKLKRWEALQAQSQTQKTESSFVIRPYVVPCVELWTAPTIPTLTSLPTQLPSPSPQQQAAAITVSHISIPAAVGEVTSNSLDDIEELLQSGQLSAMSIQDDNPVGMTISLPLHQIPSLDEALADWQEVLRLQGMSGSFMNDFMIENEVDIHIISHGEDQQENVKAQRRSS